MRLSLLFLFLIFTSCNKGDERASENPATHKSRPPFNEVDLWLEILQYQGGLEEVYKDVRRQAIDGKDFNSIDTSVGRVTWAKVDAEDSPFSLQLSGAINGFLFVQKMNENSGEIEDAVFEPARRDVGTPPAFEIKLN